MFYFHQTTLRSASCCLATFVSQQQLESVVWRSNSPNIVSAHNDGSFVVWDAETGEQAEPPNTPYGPYPCKVASSTPTHYHHGPSHVLCYATWSFCVMPHGQSLYSRQSAKCGAALDGTSLQEECQGRAMETSSQ